MGREWSRMVVFQRLSLLSSPRFLNPGCMLESQESFSKTLMPGPHPRPNSGDGAWVKTRIYYDSMFIPVVSFLGDSKGQPELRTINCRDPFTVLYWTPCKIPNIFKGQGRHQSKLDCEHCEGRNHTTCSLLHLQHLARCLLHSSPQK